MKYHLLDLTKMIERLKICWYALTKRHYCFFAYDREEYRNSGAKCIIEDEAENSKVFLGAMKVFIEQGFPNRRKEETK